jgi:hypothetical protein
MVLVRGWAYVDTKIATLATAEQANPDVDVANTNLKRVFIPIAINEHQYTQWTRQLASQPSRRGILN